MRLEFRHTFLDSWWMWKDAPVVVAMAEVHLEHFFPVLAASGPPTKTAVAERLSRQMGRDRGTVMRLLSASKDMLPGDTLGIALTRLKLEPGDLFPAKVPWLAGMVRKLCPDVGEAGATAYARYRALRAGVEWEPDQDSDPELCPEAVRTICLELKRPTAEAPAVAAMILNAARRLGTRLMEIKGERS
jgi:hypothetical protein